MFVITARHQHRENGQIATWIVPATLVPDSPRVVTVLSPRNFTHSLIENSGRFVINMLADEQADLVPLFGLVSGNEIDKFDGLEIGRTATGLPVLPGTCGWAECAIIAMIDSGDRRIYLADVVEQRVNPGKVPLRKADAFSRQPADILRLLQEKHRLDGIKDALLQKKFGHP
ncbi:MAG: flavin reductase [Ignavibacteria bacterium]|nr:flavin reductase [Ignavibacteria bacterium]